MKLAEYKELVVSNPQLAMIIDLSERHPRGPDALLRGHHYRQQSGAGWYDRHETEIDPETLVKKSAPVLEKISLDGKICLDSFGYPVLELRKFFKKHNIRDQYDFRRAIEDILMTGEERSPTEQRIYAQFIGWGKQATRTRRSKRLYHRFRQLNRWIENNIKTAYYRINLGYGLGSGSVYIHADSDTSAMTQFEMFIKPALTKLGELNRASRDYFSAEYVEPALEGPVGLMTKNAKYAEGIDKEISDMQNRIAVMQAKIEAMNDAKMMVNQYTINMTCSYEYKNEEN